MSSNSARSLPKKKSVASGSWWFLLAAIALYVFLFFLHPALFKASFNYFVKLLKTIAPILALVMAFMWILDLLVNPKRIRGLLGHEAGLRGWVIAIIGGVLSHGPVYAWYPLLTDLQKQGARPAFIAAFLYARSIKLPWLPMLAFYFGTTYMMLLTVIILLISPLMGWLTERSCCRRV